MQAACRACLPLLDKDHSLTMRIKPVAAICCDEKAGRIKIGCLSLPVQVCKLYLQLMYTCTHMHSFSAA